jgi:SAM-dependent MidA family methyltransferase
MATTPKPLLEKIKRMTAINGPLSIAEYMHICMADPTHGYYKTCEAIGQKGDFITAPEISQMFGELIGIWCIATWQELGRPKPFCIAELGPGKGTLMQDLLRAAKANSDFMESMQVVLVETSAAMQETQKSKLPNDLVKNGKIKWEIDIAHLPHMPTIFVANEFFDVIPFRQYVKKQSAWHEIGIGLSKESDLQKLALANCIEPSDLPQQAGHEPEGAIFEHAPARNAVAQAIAEHIKANTGAALAIDYGHLKSGFGDTFQAMANHAYVDALSSPGMHDLTSHVDFAALIGSVHDVGLKNTKQTTQGEFLLNLGLLERAGSLGRGKSEADQNRIRSEVERLAAPDQMGSLFKVLAIASDGVQLAGFEASGLQGA